MPQKSRVEFMKIRKHFSMKTSQDSKQVKLITRGLTGVSVVLLVCSLWPYDDDNAIALAPSINILTAPPSPLPLPNEETKSSLSAEIKIKKIEIPNKPRPSGRQKVSFVDYGAAITVRVRPHREKLQLTSREMRKKAGTLYFFDTASMAHFCCHHGGEPVCAPICIKGLPGYHYFEMFHISNTSGIATGGEDEKGKQSVALPPLPMLYDSDDFKSRCAPLPGLKYFPRLDGPPRPFDIREEDACLGGGWEKILPSLEIRANLSEITTRSSGLPPVRGRESALDNDRASSPFVWLFDNQKKSSSDALDEENQSREGANMNTITWNAEPFCVQADGTVEMLAQPSQRVDTEDFHSSLFAEKNVRIVDSLGTKKGSPALIIPIKSRGRAIRDSLQSTSSPDAESMASSSFAANQTRLFVRAAHASALRRASYGLPPPALLLVTEISDPREALHLSSLDARGALHTDVLFASYYALLDLPTYAVNVALEAPTRSSVFCDSQLFSSHANANKIKHIDGDNRGRQLVPMDAMNERFSRSVWNEAVRLLFLEAKHLRALRGRKHQYALDTFVPDLEPWKPSVVPKDPTEREIFAELGKQPPTSPDDLVRIGDEKLYEGRLDVYLAEFLRRTLTDLDKNERNAEGLGEKSGKIKKCFSGCIYLDNGDGHASRKSVADSNAEQVSGEAMDSLKNKRESARRISAQCAFGSSLPLWVAQNAEILTERQSSRKELLSSANELMLVKAAGEHFLLTEAAEKELSGPYVSAVVSPHGKGKDLSSYRKKYDETFMRLLEAHPIRLTWLINTKTSTPTTHAEISSLFSTSWDHLKTDRPARSATLDPRIRLVNEHFVAISKEFSKHISFFFSDGVDKERVDQLRRLMGHTDIVLSEEGMGGAAGLVRDGPLSVNSFSLRDSALLVELGTTRGSASGSHSVKNEALLTSLRKQRSHSYLRIPPRFAAGSSSGESALATTRAQKRHNALTLDETRSTISLAVCSWLASNAIRLNKPFLVPFWCSGENGGEEDSPLLSSTPSSEETKNGVHVSSQNKYPTADDVENLVKLTKVNQDRKTFLPDWLNRAFSFVKGTVSSEPFEETLGGEINSVKGFAITRDEPKRTPFGGFVAAKCRPIAGLLTKRNASKKRDANHSNDDETLTPLQVRVPPSLPSSNSPLILPPNKLLSSFPFPLDGPDREMALSLFEDAVQAECADRITRSTTESATSSSSLDVSSALDETVRAMFRRLRAHAFLGLRGLLESVLLLPLEAASDLSHLITYGNPRLLTFYKKRADQLRIQAENDVEKKSRRGKKANSPVNSQLDAVVDVESLCGLKPLFADLELSVDSEERTNANKILDGIRRVSPIDDELACLRMVLSYALSPASRPHKVYRITAEQEDTSFRERNRGKKLQPATDGPFDFNPLSVEPLMSDDVLELLERLPVPPIRYTQTRELMVRWVASEFSEAILASI